MLSYSDFEKHINTIKYYSEIDNKLSEILDVDGVVCHSTQAIGSIVDLLKVIMGDTDNDWIEYWMWELDFGVKDENCVTIHGVPVPLTTIKDLYSMLLKGRDND